VAAAPVAPETPAEAPVAAPARAAAAPEPAPAPASQAPAAAPVAQAPTPAPASGLAAPERTVPLHRAPAAVSTLLHVAVERGISHAKMALRPAELGGIEIRLQATAGGVAAQVVADSPEAARMLAQAGDDLRRALEARDVTLISLEVSTSSEQQQQSARGEWTDGGDAGLTSSHGRTAGDAESDAEPAPITQTVIELPGGLLVDVLA
jgi:flagellar hook-length control protein FliK